MKKLIILVSAILCLNGSTFAQSPQHTLWGAWFHSQKLSEHWGYAFDGQFRSADKADYLRNILLRPSVAYYISKNKTINVGYAYIVNHGRDAAGGKTFRPESRTWEQFTLSTKTGSIGQLTNRFRLEQRYVGDAAASVNNHYFSQRFRYFIREVIPFSNEAVFVEGAFLALQNEVFLNLQNKQKVNGHLFDQNRAYLALGYRFSKQLDIEAGYLNQYVKAVTSGTVNHALQLAVYTRF